MQHPPAAGTAYSSTFPVSASVSVRQPSMAFDARGHVRDVFERRGLFEALDLLLARLTVDHAQEGAAHFQRLFLLLSHDHAEHDIRRCLRDGTSVADKTAVGNDIAVGLELEDDVVAAAWVHARKFNVCVRNVVLELRMDVVLGQDLIIEASIFHIPYAPSGSRGSQGTGRHPHRCYKRQSWRAPSHSGRGARAAAARSGVRHGCSLRRTP